MNLYIILAIISIFPCWMYIVFMIDWISDLKKSKEFSNDSSKQDELIKRWINSIRHNLPNFVLSLVIIILLFSLSKIS